MWTDYLHKLMCFCLWSGITVVVKPHSLSLSVDLTLSSGFPCGVWPASCPPDPAAFRCLLWLLLFHVGPMTLPWTVACSVWDTGFLIASRRFHLDVFLKTQFWVSHWVVFSHSIFVPLNRGAAHSCKSSIWESCLVFLPYNPHPADH